MREGEECLGEGGRVLLRPFREARGALSPPSGESRNCPPHFWVGGFCPPPPAIYMKETV